VSQARERFSALLLCFGLVASRSTEAMRSLVPLAFVRAAGWVARGLAQKKKWSCLVSLAAKKATELTRHSVARSPRGGKLWGLPHQAAQHLPMPRMRNPRSPPDHRAIGSREPGCSHHRSERHRLEMRPDLPREGARIEDLGLPPLPVHVRTEGRRVSRPATACRLSTMCRVIPGLAAGPEHFVCLRDGFPALDRLAG